MSGQGDITGSYSSSTVANFTMEKSAIEQPTGVGRGTSIILLYNCSLHSEHYKPAVQNMAQRACLLPELIIVGPAEFAWTFAIQ